MHCYTTINFSTVQKLFHFLIAFFFIFNNILF